MGELIKTNDNNIDAPLDDLITCVKRTILSYFPYTHDRTDLVANGNAPELKIIISNSPTNTCILYSTRRFPENKPSYVDYIMATVPEREILNRFITYEETEEIIDFIIKDHKYFEEISFKENYSKYRPYEMSLKFKIHWPDSEGPKLYCGNIGIELDFCDRDVAYEYHERILKKFKPRLTYKYVNKR